MMDNPDLVLQETGDSSPTHSRLAECHDNKLSSQGQTIQTQWSLLPEVSQAICSWWTCLPPGHTTNASVSITSARPPSMCSGCTQFSIGGSGPICLPTSSHLGQGMEKLQDYQCRKIILIAPGWHNMPCFWDLVTMSSQIPLCLPNLLSLFTQPFNQTLHRNLSNLNLHAWLLEPQQSRSRSSWRLWQHKFRFLKEDQPDQTFTHRCQQDEDLIRLLDIFHRDIPKGMEGNPLLESPPGFAPADKGSI